MHSQNSFCLCTETLLHKVFNLLNTLKHYRDFLCVCVPGNPCITFAVMLLRTLTPYNVMCSNVEDVQYCRGCQYSVEGYHQYSVGCQYNVEGFHQYTGGCTKFRCSLVLIYIFFIFVVTRRLGSGGQQCCGCRLKNIKKRKRL